jgi:hypothetical protein
VERMKAENADPHDLKQAVSATEQQAWRPCLILCSCSASASSLFGLPGCMCPVRGAAAAAATAACQAVHQACRRLHVFSVC